MNAHNASELITGERLQVKILEFIHHKEKAKDSFSMRIIITDPPSFCMSKHPRTHEILLCAYWPFIMLQTHFKGSVSSPVWLKLVFLVSQEFLKEQKTPKTLYIGTRLMRTEAN